MRGALFEMRKPRERDYRSGAYSAAFAADFRSVESANGSGQMKRRTVLFGVGAAAACATTPAPTDARETLLAFLHAFENCDLPAMEGAFAPDATHFDRALPTANGDLGVYRRGQGMPPGMRHIAETLPRTQPGPPYHHVTPEDLLVQGDSDVAVCTFHLPSADSLGRRTVVLQRRAGVWKIIHIHASNVSGVSSQ